MNTKYDSRRGQPVPLQDGVAPGPETLAQGAASIYGESLL